MALIIQTITNGRWRENCYIAHNEHQEAIVIDPGGAANLITEYIEAMKLNTLAILNTHAHYDHLGAVAELQTTLGVPFFLHSKELRMLKRANLFRKIFDADDPISLPSVDYCIDQVETPIHLGTLSIAVLSTPGHTEGSVCFQLDDRLFPGDTLLKGRVGRVDLPGGDRSTLNNSLKRLSELPPQTKLYPGHGGTSTMFIELQTNPEFLKALE